MPNWTRNTLEITGDVEDLKRFRAAAVGYNPWQQWRPDRKTNALNFHSLVPVPGAVIKAGYDPVGCDWQCENWGCKWSACESELKIETAERLLYWFETPWSPPFQLLQRISVDWHSLVFVNCFVNEDESRWGDATAKNGLLILDYRKPEGSEDKVVRAYRTRRRPTLVAIS